MPCLNPLHCGAVVASLGKAITEADAIVESQSPSLRGSGRFPPTAFRRRSTIACLNPLHCGAVVASTPAACGRRGRSANVSIPFIAGQWSLRNAFPPRRGGASRVSIPFIAGQWSLPAGRRAADAQRGESQSPSLRGSGRFNVRWDAALIHAAASQSPSLRGSGRFSAAPNRLATPPAEVSIPFIAGQWSLQGN